MEIRRCIPALLTAALFALAGCGDGLTAPEAASVADDPSPVASGVPVSGSATQALGLSDGVRTAMMTTLTAALAELDLEPEVPLSMLQEFFQHVEAQESERLRARAALLRTVQP